MSECGFVTPHVSYVAPLPDAGEASGEDALAEGVDLDLSDDVEAGEPERPVESPDTREETDCDWSVIAHAEPTSG